MKVSQGDPHLFVVMGGTGDLMRQKLLPALHHLATSGLLADCCILAVARRTDREDAGFRQWAREALALAQLPVDDPQGWCDRCLHYHALGEGRPADYQSLPARIAEIEREHGLPGNRVFYLALPPAGLADALQGLGAAGLAHGPGWTRVVVEKPFGHDLASARELNRLLHQDFAESQIYRIDHYLGKETVQNLLVFRFANPIFESVWNRSQVQSVQITVAEAAGVGTRGRFYEQTGAVRDMAQNHLTQLLCLVAMEVPAAFEADAIRDEKAKVLKCIEPIRPEDVVLGQYEAGEMGDETAVGYRDEAGVDPDSGTETFAALRLRIANWRWEGVPFYLRTGKRLPRRTTQIVITFRCPPTSFFAPFAYCSLQSNALVLTLQPDEGFDLDFEVKVPGEPFRAETQKLVFRYADVYGRIWDAYETLLLDVITGDPTLFVRADEAELAWQLYAPVLESPPEVHPYPAGSWGPAAADRLLEPRDLQWFTH